MKLIRIAAFSLFTFILMASFRVYAAEPPVVVGLHIEEARVNLYIHGELPSELSAKVSGQDCELETSDFAAPEAESRTLFLIDISTSMRQGSQQQVRELLGGMLDSKPESEEYAVAVFDEEYRLLADFTDDRYELAQTAEALVWDGQSSSIYRAVDDAASAIREQQADEWAFTQIVIFSDGVEKAEDGIIKEELFFRLNESPLPVHTIGFAYENNAEGLKELYAISRMTGGLSYGLEAGSDAGEAVSQLAEYRDGVSRIQILLPEGVRDGAVRPLELFDGEGASILRYDLHMPAVLTAEAETSPASEAPSATEATTTAVIPKPAAANEAKEPLEWKIVIPLIALALVVVAVIIEVILYLKKKRKLKQEEYGDGAFLSDQTEYADMDGDATEYLIMGDSRKSGSGYYLILNDLAQPHKRFESLVENKLEVGRNPGGPGITIDYDKKISRQHFAVTRRDGGLWIEDLGSANKTYVNDEIITAPRALRDNDVISCGKTRLSVKIERR